MEQIKLISDCVDVNAMKTEKTGQDTQNVINLARSAKELKKMGYLKINETVFYALAKWRAEFIQGNCRGLLLTGNVGTGKTFFAQKVISNKYKIQTSISIVGAFKRSGGDLNSQFWFESFRIFDAETWLEKLICIDDLGQEPLLNLYGTKTEVMEHVICARYADWKRTKSSTIITSNLSINNIHARYGSRVTDRLREMCDLVEFEGQSMRSPEGKVEG